MTQNTNKAVSTHGRRRGAAKVAQTSPNGDKIKTDKLYRREAETFEAYCQERWGFARNYANKLIAGAKVVSELGTTVPITSERQARELARVPEADREGIDPGGEMPIMFLVVDSPTPGLKHPTKESSRCTIRLQAVVSVRVTK